MVQRKDSRENNFGGRSYNSPSNMTRIGNGLRFTAASADPNTESDGVPVQDWKSVHVIFFGDENTYTGLTATFRPWRWYSKQTDGQSGVSNAEVGRWVPDFEVTVALDPARISATISSHLSWPTRDAEKMYWQLLGVWDSEGNAGVIPNFVMAQPFGEATPNDAVGVAVSSSAGGGGLGSPCCPAQIPFMASVKATHWSPADGTATFASAVTLNTAGFPFVVDDANCEVLGIVVRKATGIIREYVNGHNGRRISATADVITLGGAGAAPFANTDTDYWVYIVHQDKAYTEATDSLRVEEIQPLNHEHTQPAYVINNQAVAADPGVSYAPSVNGIVMDGYKDIAFQLYLLGGIGAGAANRTVTVTFEGSNDAEVPAGTRQWDTLGVGYDLVNDGTQAAWTATGATPLVTQVDFDNWMHKRIRVRYDWDADPSVTNGMIVITERRKAL
jgi:hypothetical protein